MRNSILMLAMMVASTYAYAQTTYKGEVKDADGVPLPGATVTAGTGSEATVTDYTGSFSIALATGNRVMVRYMGYVPKEVTLSSGMNTVVLTVDENVLKEVVVSGSREQQQRDEVPAAISVVSSKKIAQTKAFGIDQLVNDVPGVFMSTSRAVSNEQHFMAVRSPISTMALFLYLEDGLPIRPTSVFNHNALLEMNDISHQRIEVLKGPASSIYGSEAIGGSFNFITKNPTKRPSGSLVIQGNDMGFFNGGLEFSTYTNEKTGFYLGTQYSQRNNGPVEHSDYEKFALTFKNVNHLSNTLNWTNVFDIIDYRSDMTGSLSEEDYFAGNYESDQTFTERDALAFRFRSTFDKIWNANNKTAFNFIFRSNGMAQNPSYRIRQFRDMGQLTGLGSGEVNDNRFRSYVALVQHRLNFDFARSTLIGGATIDYSPQNYVAETTTVIVDPETGRNIDFTINSGDFILNYDASILNYAGYLQYELNPTEALKVTAAVRYDKFEYDFDNNIAGLPDSRDSWDNVSPKLGVNYNVSSKVGFYANYSNGFTPPQVSTLYRNRNENRNIRPSVYDNFEVGTYLNPLDGLRLDVALYKLDGRNTLITLRDEEDRFYNTNAGETESYGVEYGVFYQFIRDLAISHNGSYARHRYETFFSGGVDYSGTDREIAPSLLGTTKLIYTPNYVQGLSFIITHELVGKYNTSFEGQVDNGDGTFGTATYDGHNIFNILLSYRYKRFEIWTHFLNIFDELYAVRASYNRFRNENTYTIGNPRAFHAGIKYHF